MAHTFGSTYSIFSLIRFEIAPLPLDGDYVFMRATPNFYEHVRKKFVYQKTFTDIPTVHKKYIFVSNKKCS